MISYESGSCFRLRNQSTLHWLRCSSVQRHEAKEGRVADKVVVRKRRATDKVCFFCARSGRRMPKVEVVKRARVDAHAVLVDLGHTYGLVWKAKDVEDDVENVDDKVERVVDEIVE